MEQLRKNLTKEAHPDQNADERKKFYDEINGNMVNEFVRLNKEYDFPMQIPNAVYIRNEEWD